jgi:hypothetical protein
MTQETVNIGSGPGGLPFATLLASVIEGKIAALSPRDEPGKAVIRVLDRDRRILQRHGGEGIDPTIQDLCDFIEGTLAGCNIGSLTR